MSKVIRKLKESEYRVLFQDSPVGISIASMDGKVISVNNTMEELVGYTESELSEIGVAKTYAVPEEREELLKLLLQTGTLRNHEIKVRKKNRNTFSASINVNTIEIGNEKLFLTSMQDISKLKKTEEENKMLLMGIEQASEGIAISDLEGNLDYLNKAFAEKHGYTKEELLGQNLEILHTNEQLEVVREANEKIRTDGEFLGEIWHKHRDGTTFPTIMHNSIIKDNNGKTIGMIGTFIDISKQKDIEGKLLKSKEKYRKSSKRANFYKDLFIHDINNVFASIMGSVELYALFKDDPNKREEKSEMINIITEQVTRGIKLISNVRKISKIEAGFKASLKEINLNKCLKDALEFTRLSFQTQNIEFKIDSFCENIVIQANDLLLDVFENILNNAIKYNRNSNPFVSIKLSEIQENDQDFIKIEFNDNGKGISDEKKKILFKVGYREEKDSKGLGFGLTLVKKIVDGYNWKMWVEDRIKGDYSKGCNFVLLMQEK